MDEETPNKKIRPLAAILAFVVIICLGFLAYYFLYPPTGKKVACDQLPSAEAVQATLAEHADTIRELEKLGPENAIRFGADTTRCSGKADIQIDYGTESQRGKIKQKIGDTFFGVPYRMFNT